MTINPQGASKTKDKASNIEREPLTFNAYVYSWEGAIYLSAYTNIHWLSESSQCIKDASDINVVWSRFVGWINNNTARYEVTILVAYNGETCDMKWLWKLTQAPFTSLTLPPKIKFFMDPYKVMSHYSSYLLNKTKTKLDSYELGVIRKYI